MLFKKGAMFGLDARIALAIFGSLSVISGAALYSAIQDAKVTQAVTYLSEMTKSLESYALDIGSLPEVNATSSYIEIKELISSTKTGWKGPYTSHNLANCSVYTDQCISVEYISSTTGFALSNFRAYKNDEATATYKMLPCTSGAECTVWLSLWNLPISMANALDEKIDGTVDSAEGKLRIITPADTKTNVYYNTGISVNQL